MPPLNTTIMWFRKDLRLKDNPALQAALQTQLPIVPVYIVEPVDDEWPIGSASKWWLHHSLKSLQKSLQNIGSDLLILNGDPEQALTKLCTQANTSHVFWNNCYEPNSIQRDTIIKDELKKKNINTQSFNSSLLNEPWDSVKDNGTPYRVFTAFWKASQRRGINICQHQPPGQLTSIPKQIQKNHTILIDDLKLLPQTRWDTGLEQNWKPGEQGALEQLQQFLDDPVEDYPSHRDLPANSGTSSLSAHLHFGEISPWHIWQSTESIALRNTQPGIINACDAFLRQIGWRDFAHHLLYHFPNTHSQPLDKRFNSFPWKNSSKILRSWQQGQTGIPIVDAGMRELWQTGWMHNRVRMIAASLLTKNLLIPWQEGAKWFWDTLVDADLANNTMGWQWTAGCGADAAPYFRIFNPVRQGERFDNNGSYVRKWIPELQTLPDKWIHRPWETPIDILEQSHIDLGKTYPNPIIDLAESRKIALSIWDEIKLNR